jgi:cytosine/adenosine deaminase-related metal-dependent hydrolase
VACDGLYEGRALIGEEFEERWVCIEVVGGRIAAIEEVGQTPDCWIVPALYNAHTHLGDMVAMDVAAEGSLMDLVTPPDGLKHRILASTSRETLTAAMRCALVEMAAAGTQGCADFREGGPEGVQALPDAADGLPIAVLCLGRDGGERCGDGVGISSVRDVHDAATVADVVRKRGGLVAVHAGERDSLDVDGAIALEPDLIVHATHATDGQLRHIADLGIPIAVCPRSNWTLGVASTGEHPPVARMLDLGCTVLLGTDNGMFVAPDLFREMAFLHQCYRIEPRDTLDAAVRASTLFAEPFYIEEGNSAHFMVIDASRSSIRFSKNILSTVIRRVSGDRHVKSVINAWRE